MYFITDDKYLYLSLVISFLYNYDNKLNLNIDVNNIIYFWFKYLSYI